jgi:S-adenosylmethionine/arginine decarboxylase-like enzyme
MERYDVNNHLFYDGYNLDNAILANPEFVNYVLKLINKHVFCGKGHLTLIPYFDGKVKEDGGVSGIVLGDGFHFTCHTFSYQNTVFVDYFGDNDKKKLVETILLAVFNTNDYDMGSKDIKGNFGKHIIIRPSILTLDEAKKMVELVLDKIVMTPINKLLICEKDSHNFDILQPIAESHISFHRKNDEMVVDAFSCKYFDVQKFLDLFNTDGEFIEVNRGLKYKKTLKRG